MYFRRQDEKTDRAVIVAHPSTEKLEAVKGRVEEFQARTLIERGGGGGRDRERDKETKRETERERATERHSEREREREREREEKKLSIPSSDLFQGKPSENFALRALLKREIEDSHSEII